MSEDFEDNLPIDRSRKQIIRLTVSGEPDGIWEILKHKIFNLLDNLSQKISNKFKTDETIKKFSEQGLKSAEAIIEKPVLQSDLLKADIAKKFAEAKRTDAEARSIELENEEKELQLNLKIKNLEQILLRIRENGAQIKFEQKKHKGYLTIKKENIAIKKVLIHNYGRIKDSLKKISDKNLIEDLKDSLDQNIDLDKKPPEG